MTINLDRILQLQKEKKKKDLEYYKNIFKMVENKIMKAAEYNYMYTTFTVPAFIFGLPPIDIPRTLEYITGLLNRKGFITIPVSFDTVFISWDLVSEHEKEMKKKEKNYNNEVSEIHNNNSLSNIMKKE